jgi:hypothetical protein
MALAHLPWHDARDLAWSSAVLNGMVDAAEAWWPRDLLGRWHAAARLEEMDARVRWDALAAHLRSLLPAWWASSDPEVISAATQSPLQTTTITLTLTPAQRAFLLVNGWVHAVEAEAETEADADAKSARGPGGPRHSPQAWAVVGLLHVHWAERSGRWHAFELEEAPPAASGNRCAFVSATPGADWPGPPLRLTVREGRCTLSVAGGTSP